MVFTAPGVLDQAKLPNGNFLTSGSVSTPGFFGYHTYDAANNFPYAMLPFPDTAKDVKGLLKAAGITPRSVGAATCPLATTALNALTGASSHEMVEGITDPV